MIDNWHELMVRGTSCSYSLLWTHCAACRRTATAISKTSPSPHSP